MDSKINSNKIEIESFTSEQHVRFEVEAITGNRTELVSVNVRVPTVPTQTMMEIHLAAIQRAVEILRSTYS